eukprot:2503289-Pyramimonas_sp.AAC.1
MSVLSQTSTLAQVYAPRQAVGSSASVTQGGTAGNDGAIGCSAFAFQGTNCHVLLNSSPFSRNQPQRIVAPRLDSRHNHVLQSSLAPYALHFNSYPAITSSDVVSHALLHLDCPRLAHILEHRINGRVVVPDALLIDSSHCYVNNHMPGEPLGIQTFHLSNIATGLPLVLPCANSPLSRANSPSSRANSSDGSMVLLALHHDPCSGNWSVRPGSTTKNGPNMDQKSDLLGTGCASALSNPHLSSSALSETSILRKPRVGPDAARRLKLSETPT